MTWLGRAVVVYGLSTMARREWTSTSRAEPRARTRRRASTLPDPAMRFKDRVVIVTGAASGIGLATATRLAAEGARVAAVVHSPEHVDATEAALRDAGAPDVLVVTADVSTEADVKRCAAETVDRWGRLDGVVNCAGVMTFSKIEETSKADWDTVLGVDLMGAFYFIREAFRRMDAGGAVVNVSSVHAVQTTPLVAPYAAAKAALDSLTRSAAIEGREKRIRVNSVRPGAIDTPMLWDNPNVTSGEETIDPADVGEPAQVAAAICFLLSDDAAFTTGATLSVDGGRLAAL